MSSNPKGAAATEDASTFQVNQKKLKELQESANAIKIGGKVCVYRKHIAHVQGSCFYFIGYSTTKEENHSSTS